jgi:uncharacterized protein YhbP (UPF0306 family)
MPIERSTRASNRARIAATARRLLSASTLCAVATASPRGSVHINSAYFAWSPGFDLVWLSDPGARHSRNLVAHAGAAIAVYDSTQVWGEPDQGIQLFGSAHQVAGPGAKDAERLYAKRFPTYPDTDLGAYRFYRFRPRRMKLFDERALGAGVFVTAAVRGGGRLAWARTEIYREQA